jgi:hypothetical protein
MLNKKSRCIDRGFSDYVDEPYDIRGKDYQRKINGKDSTLENFVDIGAYEYNYINDAVSVKERDLYSSLSVFPNPSANFITISETDTNLYTNYEIYDISGRLLQKDALSSNRIDVSRFEHGSYNLRLISPTGIANTLFLKMD